MAGLDAVRSEIERRGAGVVVIGSGGPDAISPFRSATRWDGRILVDPSLAAYRTAGFVGSFTAALDPRGAVRLVRALVSGFRAGAITGNTLQQGGTLVIGPGDVVHFAWRDRFTGDMPPVERVVAAIPA